MAKLIVSGDMGAVPDPRDLDYFNYVEYDGSFTSSTTNNIVDYFSAGPEAPFSGMCLCAANITLTPVGSANTSDAIQYYIGYGVIHIVNGEYINELLFRVPARHGDNRMMFPISKGIQPIIVFYRPKANTTMKISSPVFRFIPYLIS